MSKPTDEAITSPQETPPRQVPAPLKKMLLMDFDAQMTRTDFDRLDPLPNTAVEPIALPNPSEK